MLLNLFNMIKQSPVVRDSAWNVGGHLASRAIMPLISILVARLLDPGEYGAYAVAMALLVFLEMLKDVGLSQSVIVDHGEEDLFSLHFTVQLVMSLALFAGLLAVSPWMADFISMPLLASILPLLSISLLLSSLEMPLVTQFMKENRYRHLCFRQIVPTVAYGLVALVLAYMGHGIFSLVWGRLTGQAVSVVLLVCCHRAPRFLWHSGALVRLLRLARHLLIQQLSGYLVLQADSLVVAKQLGGPNVGAYRMGHQLTVLVPNAIMPQVQQVTFSAMAARKNDIDYLGDLYNRFVLLAGIFSLVFAVLVVVTAPWIIPLVMGAQWAGIVPIVQALSLTIPTANIVVLNNDLSKVLGFSHVYSYYSIIRAAVTIGAVFAASFFSLEATVIAWVLVALLSNAANEVLFRIKQDSIPRRRAKVFLFAIAWAWAALILPNIWS